MIFTEGPRGISPFPSGLGVARPRSGPRLLGCPGCLAWSLPGVLPCLTRTREKRKSGPRARTRERTQGRTQAAARVNASLSVNNERELRWPTRTDFRHFGTTRTRSYGVDAAFMLLGLNAAELTAAARGTGSGACWFPAFPHTIYVQSRRLAVD